MKVPAWISILLVCAVILFAILWYGTNMQKKQLTAEKDSIRTDYEQATKTIYEIQGNLETIESTISGDLTQNKEIPGSGTERRNQIINTIVNMKKQITDDKKRIADLEKKLANSKVQLKGIQDLVDKLKASIADKEKIVAELSDKLGVMKETLAQERQLSAEEIAKRDKDIAEKQSTIETQNKDINTIFYAVGMRKDLVDKKIINRSGGVLGMGKVSTVKNTADLDKFQTFDLAQADQITFPYSKKGYSILSNQNAASYKVEKTGNLFTLKVLNKEMFRKDKILVIELL